jgi:orotate phosphoribosyltransferase
MDAQKILVTLRERNAFLKGHFEVTPNLHSDEFLVRRTVLRDEELMLGMCAFIAYRFSRKDVECVIGPVRGGFKVAKGVARELSIMDNRAITPFPVNKDERDFYFDAGLEKHIRGKRALLVHDILHSGKSLRRTFELSRDAGVLIAGVAVLFNRPSNKPIYIGEIPEEIPEVYAVLDLRMKVWDPRTQICPMCLDGVELLKVVDD